MKAQSSPEITDAMELLSQELFARENNLDDDDETVTASIRTVLSALSAALAAGRGEPAGWQTMDTAPKDGTRVLLAWEPFEHVELGKWKAGTGWCNTYGKPFSGDPHGWAALAPFPALVSAPAEPEPYGYLYEVRYDGDLWSGTKFSYTDPAKHFKAGEYRNVELLYKHAPAEPAEPVAWRDPHTAPRDGTMLRLLAQPGTGDDEGWTPFADSSDPYETIGFNALADTDVDEWQFAGWDWSHDCFTNGAGTVIGWLPFTAAPPVSPGSALRDALEDCVKQLQNVKQGQRSKAMMAAIGKGRAALAAAQPGQGS